VRTSIEHSLGRQVVFCTIPAALLPIYVLTFSFQEIFLMALIIFLASIFTLDFQG
jgi:hypothetical protein